MPDPAAPTPRRIHVLPGNAPPDAYGLMLHRRESPWATQAALAR